ncbi:protein PHYTOCHROME KINASE SUBSTRATE 4-like [Apium graveolens]|uniref:protein PHYTOCHROME KINASE SUBSTRATE 4-like n=1 Tax=Apium graveolens TaxID=4045 RepID=UPI003D7A2517
MSRRNTMETPPVIKLNLSSSSSSSVSQPPIFSHNTNTMETPQLQFHTASVFPNTNNQITYLKPPPSETKSSLPHVVVEDAEISIFDAQKYFNDTSHPKTRLSISPTIISTPNHDDETTISNNNVINPSRLSCGSAGYNRVRSFHATPTASSEASWNSQTGLLSHPAGGLAVSLRNPNSNPKIQEKLKGGSVSNGSTKWFFRPKCPCSGKKSVQVKEPAANLYSKPPSQPDHQQQQLEQQSVERVSISSSSHSKNLIPPSRYDQFSSKVFQTHQPRLSGSGRPVSESTTGGFSFPILNSLSLPSKQSPLDEPPRESLEIFQPAEEVPALRKTVGGRGFGFPGSPMSRVVGLEDDIASDASSDLFEIESFSTQTTSYPMYPRRDSLDEAQNFNTRRVSASNIYGRRSVDEAMTPPTECYEPSEASIDWSVTTAEGFDRSSVTNFSISASEFDEVSMARQAWMQHNGGGRYKKASGGGLLMSCRQEKAVSVGPQPVRCTVGEGQHGGMAPLMSTLMHVGGRVLQNNNNNNNNNNSNKNKQSQQQPPLARSHSARLSRAFAA